jgi:hypothetical protein
MMASQYCRAMSDESAVTKQEILASWRDTPTTRAITDFVANWSTVFAS